MVAGRVLLDFIIAVCDKDIYFVIKIHRIFMDLLLSEGRCHVFERIDIPIKIKRNKIIYLKEIKIELTNFLHGMNWPKAFSFMA